jgi:hypothetical protein
MVLPFKSGEPAATLYGRYRTTRSGAKFRNEESEEPSRERRKSGAFADVAVGRAVVKEDLAEVRAFDALAKHPRLADLVALVRAVVSAAAETRADDWRAAENVTRLAEERKLTSDDAATELGDPLRVLEVGPTSKDERVLAHALWGHALAESRPTTTEEEDKLASKALWLATHTPFDATMLLDRALGDDAADLWAAVADRIRRIDQGTLGDLGRAEALVGAAALAASPSPSAEKHAAILASEVKDTAIARLLRGGGHHEDAQIDGEVLFAPRGPFATTLLALSGLLFLMHAAMLAAKLALAYKAPGHMIFSERGVRVRWRIEMLGRTLGDREVVVVREGIARIVREARYPRAAFYAGLLALAVGSLVGVRAVADGVRSASPPLLLTGLVIIAIGILLDFALGSVAPGVSGRCRVVLVPKSGASICIAKADAQRADAALAKLAGS